MKTLHLHLDSGAHLAWDLDDVDADDLAACVCLWWRDPDQVRTTYLELGERDVIDSWVPLDRIVAVQVHPVAERTEEVVPSDAARHH